MYIDIATPKSIENIAKCRILESYKNAEQNWIE